MLLKETTVHAYLCIRFVLSVQSIMGEYNYGDNLDFCWPVEIS